MHLALRRLLLNRYAGFFVILTAGQSNGQGRYGPVDTTGLDRPHPRIFQFACSGASNNQVITALDPLYHVSGTSAGSVGPAMTAATKLLPYISPDLAILIVPQNTGSTGFTAGVGGSAGWLPNGSLYNAAVTAANKALSLPGKNRMGLILFDGGECDQLNGVTTGNFAYYMDSMISGFRSAIRGATNVPFVCIGLNLSYSTGWTSTPAIEAALANVGYRNLNSAYVLAGNTSGNDIHFNAVDQRTNGLGVANAVISGLSTSTVLPGQPTGLTSGSQTRSSVALSWTAPSSTNSSVPTDYTIEYSLAGANSWTTFVHPRSALTSTTVTSLPSASTSYDFRVSATSTPGTGTPSSILTTSTNTTIALVWDASNCGALAVLSNGNLDFNISSSGWTVGRTVPRKSTGKWYGELLLNLTSGTNIGIGFSDLTNIGDPGTFLGNYQKSGGVIGTSRTVSGISAGTATMASFPAVSNGNIYGLAFDADAGKGWISVNGSFPGGQDPANGTNPVFTWTANMTIGIAAAIFATGNKLTIQNTLTYTPPAGFSQIG